MFHFHPLMSDSNENYFERYGFLFIVALTFPVHLLPFGSY
jgi:hypothetical protein